ncbi:MAG: hypothetical protein JWO12_3566 [Frankiales bacterium]|nr:hypothetical protein [Frankiales bacterium]
MKGSYRVGDLEEAFTCGDGWYLGQRPGGDRVELFPDGRLIVLHDGWEVRGGRTGPDVVWVRGEQEHSSVAAGFTGTSPGYDLATARLLALQVGQSRQLKLVEITEPVAAARTVTHAWARTEGTEPDVDRYEVADLDTGERWVVHLAGEVLVSSRTAHLVSLTR